LLNLGKFQAEQSGAGSQHEIEAGRHKSLVAAVDFAEAALGAIAVDGIAHRSPGGNHANACEHSRRLSGTHPPSQEKGAAVDAAALLTYGAEVVVAPQTLPGAKVHLRRP
jgi:hypothetical protein